MFPHLYLRYIFLYVYVSIRWSQHFFLIYARDSYIAKISGKKYYLSDLGAEEYAIKAIADLLTMGMPPGAEGPDQEADNDMTKDADETPDAEPADDTGGDEEELAESVDDIPDSEKDDYGRPFVDPKGSRTFMDDGEIEKIMNRLGEKLSTKKLRILKEAEEKKTFSKSESWKLSRRSFPNKPIKGRSWKYNSRKNKSNQESNKKKSSRNGYGA